MKNNILPVILSGGTGTRMWPLSRASFPKQYHEINGIDSLSFLQATVQRILGIENIDAPLFVCNEDHRFIVAEQIRNINVNPFSILLEPSGRNTAPAIIAASLKALKEKNDPLILVLPADHIIKDENTFLKVIKKALIFANEGNIVTFGVLPNKAEIGYGYIEAEKQLDFKKINAEKILRFIEKPNKITAQKLISDKKYSWNSGIYFFRSSVFLKEASIYCPDIYKLCEESLLKSKFDIGFQRLDKEIFSRCEKISIDDAIMEKTNKGIVLPLDAGWSDIGNWQSMWEVSKKDHLGNVELGRITTKNVKNSYIRSQDKIIVGIGVEDLIIIETNDAILVANKECSQDLKNVVEFLENNGEPEATTHKKIFRPWGNYTSLAEGENWQVKKIIVNPGESLSLQLHKHRTEHWIVVNGSALVEIDGKEEIRYKNESVYIPLATKHRLSNIGNDKLILIEVQSGDYLGEDDIIRFEDNYGRAN